MSKSKSKPQSPLAAQKRIETNKPLLQFVLQIQSNYRDHYSDSDKSADAVIELITQWTENSLATALDSGHLDRGVLQASIARLLELTIFLISYAGVLDTVWAKLSTQPEKHHLFIENLDKALAINPIITMQYWSMMMLDSKGQRLSSPESFAHLFKESTHFGEFKFLATQNGGDVIQEVSTDRIAHLLRTNDPQLIAVITQASLKLEDNRWLRGVMQLEHHVYKTEYGKTVDLRPGVENVLRHAGADFAKYHSNASPAFKVLECAKETNTRAKTSGAPITSYTGSTFDRQSAAHASPLAESKVVLAK
jgi:hypothetical protein